MWLATDIKLNRDVAIKILPKSSAVDPDRLARFTREAQVLGAADPPNIAAIYGVESARCRWSLWKARLWRTASGNDQYRWRKRDPCPSSC